MRHPFISASWLCGSTVLVLALASPAGAASFERPWTLLREAPRNFSLLPEIRYFTTDSNFDGTGQKKIPTGGFQRYSRLQTDFFASYGLSRYVTVFARLSWARVQADHTTLGSDLFGFDDQQLGLSFHAFDVKMGNAAPLSIDLQLALDFPAYTNPKANDRLFLGDGSMDFTTGGFLTWPFARTGSGAWVVSAGGGYTYRSSGFSAALPWSADVRYAPRGTGLWAGAGAFGFYSLKSDSSNITLSPAGTVGGAGSFYINAINPSILALRGQLGYQVNNRLGFVLASQQNLWGQSAPSGFSFSFGLQARLGPRTAANTALLSPQDYGKSNQGFVSYSFEGKVIRVNDRMNLVKIDKGSQDGVEVNQVFDIFGVKTDGTLGEAVARAKCMSVKPTEAALEITEYFKEVWIEEGFQVKRPVQ